MSTYKISDDYEINLQPTYIEEICQNVSMILKTIKGSFPMSRGFGITDAQDEPVNLIEARLSAEIAEQIGRLEPRCKLKGVEYSGDSELKISVVIEIG